MTVALQPPAIIEPAPSLGQSPEAGVADDLIRAIFASAEQRTVFAELNAACAKARIEDWDGEGARAVTPAAHEKAIFLLNALLPGFEQPEFVVDSDGEVEFDWMRGRDRLLSLSISGAGRISFAWVIGARRGRGTEWFDGRVPTTIAAALAELGALAATATARRATGPAC